MFIFLCVCVCVSVVFLFWVFWGLGVSFECFIVCEAVLAHCGGSFAISHPTPRKAAKPSIP